MCGIAGFFSNDINFEVNDKYRQMNVLIVDDDKLARKGLVAIMDWKKYELSNRYANDICRMGMFGGYDTRKKRTDDSY